MLAGQRVESLLTVLGERDVVIFQAEGTLKRPPDGGLIVHHQHMRHDGMMARTRKSS
jgi:hypothetical protein